MKKRSQAGQCCCLASSTFQLKSFVALQLNYTHQKRGGSARDFSPTLTELIEASLTISLDQDTSAPVPKDADRRQMVSTGRVLPLICKRRHQYTIYCQNKRKRGNKNKNGQGTHSLKTRLKNTHQHFWCLPTFMLHHSQALKYSTDIVTLDVKSVLVTPGCTFSQSPV